MLRDPIVAVLAGVLILHLAGWAQPQKAPDFSPDAVWIDNGIKGPHSIKGYRGHVLLIDFWEYTCINCVRDFEVVKRWYKKYRPYGFDVVGVHYGEFPMGFSVENVRDAAKRFDLPWPVVADVKGAIWTAYQCEAWPSRYLVDANGNIVMRIEGESHNEELEAKIRGLLSGSHPEVTNVPPDREENTFAPSCGVTTAEMLMGDGLGPGTGALANPEGYHDGSVKDYHAHAEPPDGRLMVSGKWRTEKDGVTSADASDSAQLHYHARSVYAVLSVENPKKPVRIHLEQDGKALSRGDAGVDVQFDSSGSYIEVARPRMYYVIRNPAFGTHQLTLKPDGKNLTLHSFSFGNDCQQSFEQK